MSGKSISRESLKVSITQHLGTGACLANESSSSHLACSSLLSQFELGTHHQEEYDCDDPNKVLQIRLLTQVCPILNLKPLRRLLELHDISYVESDKKRQLRRRLGTYLHQLKFGKLPEDETPATNSEAKQQRARERAQLQAAWPQASDF
ncbi:hypothetical protein B0H11DRAFT_1932993 [Mycena galericulata]|nr:hypothetical protein B0H11DRAFT_1932993 [Mycena galericulata]